MSPTVDIFLLAAAALAAFNLCLAATAATAPLAALYHEITAASQKRVLLKKLAQHTSGLLILCALYVGLVVVGTAGLAVYRIGPEVARFAQSSLVVSGLGSLAALLLAALVYKGTWTRFRRQPGPHIAIGVITCLIGLAFAAAALFCGYLAAILPAELWMNVCMTELALPPMGSIFWPLATWALTVGLCATGGLGLLHLISRRAKDDFGRDYYNTAFRRTAAWGGLFGVLQIAATAWSGYVLRPGSGVTSYMDPLAIAYGAGFVLLVAAIGMWLAMARSPMPLRLKWMAYPAMLFQFLAVTGVFYVLAVLATSPAAG